MSTSLQAFPLPLLCAPLPSSPMNLSWILRSRNPFFIPIPCTSRSLPFPLLDLQFLLHPSVGSSSPPLLTMKTLNPPNSHTSFIDQRILSSCAISADFFSLSFFFPYPIPSQTFSSVSTFSSFPSFLLFFVSFFRFFLSFFHLSPLPLFIVATTKQDRPATQPSQYPPHPLEKADEEIGRLLTGHGQEGLEPFSSRRTHRTHRRCSRRSQRRRHGWRSWRRPGRG